MRTCVILLCACAALAALGPAPAAGQLNHSLFLGGGLTIPTSDYGNYAKTGWLGLGGVTLSKEGSPVWYGAEGLIGRNAHDDDTGDVTYLYGGNAFVGYDIGHPSGLQPYVYGSAGMLVHHWSPGDTSLFDSTNDTKFSVGGGVGVDIPLGGARMWVEGKFLTTLGGDETTAIIPILIGFSFGS